MEEFDAERANERVDLPEIDEVDFADRTGAVMVVVRVVPTAWPDLVVRIPGGIGLAQSPKLENSRKQDMTAQESER